MAENVKWTAEQLSVIDSRDQSLLVSAAAGSGKTAVLVQRILDQILDRAHPVEIDRMLIVTFTNAAAMQLREKIRSRLEEVQDEASAAGDERTLDTASRQLSLLAGDHIETIDRFCKEVVLDHASLIGIDPSFRIGDDGELKLLQSDAAAQVIEEAYADEDSKWAEDYRVFSQLYAPGKTDSKLEDLILRFYRFSQSHAFPKIWRRECALNYSGDASGSEWMKSFLSTVQMTVRELHALHRGAMDVCRQIDGPAHYLDALEDDERILNALENCTETEEYRRILSGITWTNLKRANKNGPYVDPAKQEYVKAARKKVKDGLEAMYKKIFPLPEEEIDLLRNKTARYMDVLADLTDAFEDTFSRMKRDRNIADFSDVAHNALRILIQTDENGAPLKNEDGGFIPTQTALEYADYYDQIYIDEYQDSNPVQELLLWSVSKEPRGEQNRFMVGDVKQSIYRFRMADPEIFNEKAQTWSSDTEAEERRIDLHANFRSRKHVIDAVNLIFRQIMRQEVGGIEYDDREELRPGYPYPDEPQEMVPELLLAEKEDFPDAGDKISAEAQMVARRILAMAGKMKIYDKETGEYRPVTYGDITILLRTSGEYAQTFARVLSDHGIPSRSGANTGYFDAMEVRTILSYLKILDNPRQDIPLAAALRSGIGGLDDRELAQIRSCSKDTSFYDSVLRYMECGEDENLLRKLERFLTMTKSLRAYVKDTPIHILLWKIFDETGYADMILASEGGRQKRANLDLLVDKAIAYEETSYRGLFHFVRYIEKLRKGEMDFGLAESPGENGNEVRIMTMHASKGLEFPVTFVSGLAKNINRTDSDAQFVLNADLGAGIDYVDEELRVRTPNRIRSVISDRIRSDSVGEELRVLYVAMTRAEQKLILTACVDDRADYLKKAALQRAVTEEKYPSTMILQTKCMLEWVIWGLIRHGAESDFFDDGRWELPQAPDSPVRDIEGRVKIITGKEIVTDAAVSSLVNIRREEDLLRNAGTAVYDEKLRERLAGVLAQHYGHEDAAGMPGKLSVSELKHAAYEAEMERLEEERDSVRLEEITGWDTTGETAGASGGSEEGTGTAGISTEGTGTAVKADIPVPAFLQESREGGLSGTARGTAYHEVLAAADFASDPWPGQVAAQLETMVKCDRIQKDEAQSVDPGKIERFLKSDLAARMRQAQRAGRLWREQPFVIGMRGDEIRDDWSRDETVLIQGIIDAFFIENENIILIDYKTDVAQPGDEQSLVNRYRKQFELYQKALEKLLGRNVTEGWLYSLSLGRAVSVPLS